MESEAGSSNIAGCEVELASRASLGRTAEGGHPYADIVATRNWKPETRNCYFITPREAILILSREVFFTRYIISSA